MNLSITKTMERWRLAHRGWRYRLRVERAEVAFLLRFYQPDKTGIDIGAHKGAFTYWMARKSRRRGHILAFEPLPELAAYLRRLQVNVPLPNMRVEELALSDHSGPRVLFRPRGDYYGMSSFTPADHEHGYEELSVQTTTLDQYLDTRRVRPVGFIKCDVEGHELEVLQGGRRMLQEDRPALLVECEDFRNGGGQLDRVRSFMDALGFQCFALFPSGICRLEDCATDMNHSYVGVDAYRNFGFLPQAQARREVDAGHVMRQPPMAA